MTEPIEIQEENTFLDGGRFDNKGVNTDICKAGGIKAMSIIDILIVIKGILLIIATMKGYMWWKKGVHLARAVRIMLIVSIVLIALQTSYGFTHRHIGPLFMLQTLAQYSVLCAFNSLMYFVKNNKFKTSSSKKFYRYLFVPFHCLYWLNFLAGVLKITKEGAYCNEDMIYPRVFLGSNFLFGSFYLISLYLHKKNYFLEWDEDTSDNTVAEIREQIKVRNMFK